MAKALAVSAAIALVALASMFAAPEGKAAPFGTLLRTAAATALLVLLGRMVGSALRRRPPIAVARNVVITMFGALAILVLASAFSPDWSVAFAAWYLTLFAVGVSLNRWCATPERYTVLVAAFCVVTTSLILMTMAAASTPTAQGVVTSNTVLIAFWPNVSRIASHPGDAAWVWFAWRVADRLRPAEARRPKAPSVRRIPSKIAPRKQGPASPKA
jgi:hypothetical protein